MHKNIVFLSLLLIAVAPNMVFAEGVKVASIAIGDNFARTEVPGHRPVTALAAGFNEGYLQHNEMAIGTILTSYHFSNNNSNETHDGIYLSMNEWSAGTFINSVNNQSVAVTYNRKLYRNELFKVSMVTGIANGYEGVDYAQGDYLPILGVSAQWGYLRSTLLPNAVAFGIELPLN